VENKISADGKLILHSLNPVYEPFEISVNDIREVWQFVNFISSEIPDNTAINTFRLAQTVKKLSEEVKAIQMRMEI